MNNIRVGILAVMLFLAPAAAFSQASSESNLVVDGDVAAPLSLTMADLRAMSQAQLQVTEEAGPKTYQGVWLRDILEKAGAPLGDALRGKALASYVLATARDGYQALFALAELDPLFRDDQVLLAYQADGEPLFAYQGPLRLVTQDKRGARSVRMLARIDVVQLRK